MTLTRRTVEIAAFATAVLLAALSIHAWLASRDEQQRLQSTLATQKQVIDGADAREHANATALAKSLAAIEKLKHDAQTPAQILRALPQYLALPQPITMNPSMNETSAPAGRPAAPSTDIPRQGTGLPERSATTAPEALSTAASSTSVAAPAPSRADTLSHSQTAQIPVADLKPLYDHVQDCRACQAQLVAAKQTQANDAAKLDALTKERDAAIVASKGGTFWRRLRRNAFWFAVGVGVGACTGTALGSRRPRSAN